MYNLMIWKVSCFSNHHIVHHALNFEGAQYFSFSKGHYDEENVHLILKCRPKTLATSIKLIICFTFFVISFVRHFKGIKKWSRSIYLIAYETHFTLDWLETHKPSPLYSYIVLL